MNQRDVGAAVWIVLNRINNAFNAILVTLEIDNSISSLVTATTMPSSNLALIVSPSGLNHWSQQAFLRLCALGQLFKVANAGITPAWRSWFVFSNCHQTCPFVVVPNRQPKFSGN
jgi:hypothetical protein